ncbi:MAG: DUF3473 domain-containing protein [Candidatus Electrothrix sp. AU1_5]|nr:DUF3473 domain-containing protein [Candidatus Electrothrix gigas]
MKYAVLSMDIEDWYHLAYFNRESCDTGISFLDGINVYKAILDQYNIKSSFFVLGELASSLKEVLCGLAYEGHDIGVHGWDHTLPLHLSPDTFVDDLIRSKTTIEDCLSMPVLGYRAPCFNLDRQRLDQIQSSGFFYDSSRILFREHPLYTTLDMNGFLQESENIFRKKDFFEFQLSTVPLFGRNIPVSGGGYLRIFPWSLMRWCTKRFLKDNELYVLYIHPFELSSQEITPFMLSESSWRDRRRFNTGRKTVVKKLKMLIELLHDAHFKFTTFSSLRQTLMQSS